MVIIYFTASVNTGPSQVGLDLSTQERPLRQGVYAAVLAADGSSPLAAGTGDEPVVANTTAQQSAAKISPIRLDLAGIEQRIVPLPLAEKNYGQLKVAADGALWLLEYSQPGASNEGPTADLPQYGHIASI